MIARFTCGLVALATISVAQETAAPRAISIEEIVVTAQKREEKFQDVPISMSVMSGDFLKEQGVADLRDLATFVPNAKIVVEQSQGGYYTGGLNIRVRGIGSAVGADTFEQPVGMAIDGDSYSKLPPFVGGLFDIERVEVLKGPQGTLFGKNTTAGLINVTTKSPTDEFSGFIDGRLGNFDSRRLEAGVGGPVLADFLNFRIAGLTDERDGWMKNTTARIIDVADDIQGGYDRKGVRVKLDAPNLYGLSLELSQEFTESESFGSTTEWIRTDSDPSPVNYFRKYDPAAEFEKGNELNALDAPQFAKTGTRRFVADGAYDLAEWRLNALVGWSAFDVESEYDGEGFPVPIGKILVDTEQPQLNLELRTTSPSLAGLFGLGRLFGVSLGESDFTLGFFYQGRGFVYLNDFNYSAPLIGEYGVVLSSGFFPPAPPGSGDREVTPPLVQRVVRFSDDSVSPAVYGQARWRFLPRWTLQFGARYTRERREGSWNVTPNNEFGRGFWTFVGFEFFNVRTERTDSAFTPAVALNYDWTDDVTFFASRSTGFKSGGFNASASNPRPESLTFEPERATSYDLGTKARFFDGRLAFNGALFWTDVTDLQSLTLLSATIPGTNQTAPIFTQYLVKNAGEARARGFEADLTLIAADWLTIFSTAALADTEYLEFPNGSCANDRADPTPENPGCDLSGRPFEFTPRWTASLTPQIRHPVAWGIEVSGGVTVQYEDVYNASRPLDSRARQPSYFKLNANLGFGHPEQRWSAGIWGQNLTDAYILLDTFFNLPTRCSSPPLRRERSTAAFAGTFEMKKTRALGKMLVPGGMLHDDEARDLLPELRVARKGQDPRADFEVWGQYHDEWRRLADGWRIASRRFKAQGTNAEPDPFEPIGRTKRSICDYPFLD